MNMRTSVIPWVILGDTLNESILLSFHELYAAKINERMTNCNFNASTFEEHSIFLVQIRRISSDTKQQSEIICFIVEI